MKESRVPEYSDHSFDGMLMWFAEMSIRELLFHPEDDPKEIINIDDGQPVFNEVECQQIGSILDSMFEQFGDEVCNAAYPVFMKRMGQRLDA
jgi:hypothetical protein